MFQAQVHEQHERLPLKPELPAGIVALAGVFFFVARQARALRKPAFVWSAITIIVLITLTSCAGIPPAAILKTPPGDYTVTVNSSGNVGAAVEAHTVNVTVTVTP